MMFRGFTIVAALLCVFSNPIDARELSEAVRLGDAPAVSLALEAGETVDSPGEFGFTPLELAALNGHADVARLLVQEGTDVHARREGDYTILMKAAAQGYTGVMIC
jgi:ankyrin repeat protein